MGICRICMWEEKKHIFTIDWIFWTLLACFIQVGWVKNSSMIHNVLLIRLLVMRMVTLCISLLVVMLEVCSCVYWHVWKCLATMYKAAKISLYDFVRLCDSIFVNLIYEIHAVISCLVPVNKICSFQYLLRPLL